MRHRKQPNLTNNLQSHPQPDPENPTTYETSRLWTEFLNAGQTGTESTLLDFSYAGYKHGEKSIPDVSYKIFNIEDYGAIPNDGKAIVKH